MAVVQVKLEHVSHLAAHRPLARALADTPADAPVAVLVHGMRTPGANLRPCPNRHIFAPIDRSAELSWPARLGLAGRDGIAIGFEWPARGWVRGVFRKTANAGEGLACLLAHLRKTAPTRRVTLLGHSMGAEVMLAAIAGLRTPPGELAILLAAAASHARAVRAIQGPAGRGMRFLNVSAPENGLFDRLLAVWLGDLAGGLLAPDMMTAHPQNWTELRLGDRAALAGLASLGHPVAGPERSVCHLSTYTRPGVLALYAALIGGRLSPEVLCGVLPPLANAAGARPASRDGDGHAFGGEAGRIPLLS